MNKSAKEPAVSEVTAAAVVTETRKVTLEAKADKMQLLACFLLLSVSLAARAHAGTSVYDIPPGELLAADPKSGQLQRMEERLIQLAARMETLTYTVDTVLAQLDSSVLQLFLNTSIPQYSRRPATAG